MTGRYGDSTRSLKAVDVQAISGHPVAPQAVLAATYHLSGDETAALDNYGRSSNPTWRQLESALAELEGAGGALVFGSGMAAISTVLRTLATPGSTVVVPADGYYQVRRYAGSGACARGPQRTAHRLHEFRGPAYIGGPPGALGRSGRRRICAHLTGHRGHR